MGIEGESGNLVAAVGIEGESGNLVAAVEIEGESGNLVAVHRNHSVGIEALGSGTECHCC